MPEMPYRYTPLSSPTTITEHDWGEGTLPLVCTRTMAFNHERYIRKCLDGILMQKTTFPVRVVVHDDASTDGTSKIIREYEERFPSIVKVVYQKENTYSKPDKYLRRKALRDLMVGKYIAPCEGDDYWTDPLKLQKQISYLENNPSFSGSFHAVTMEYQNRNKKKVIRHRGKSEIDLGYYLRNKIFIATNSMVYRSDVVENIPDWAMNRFAFDFILKYLILIKGNFKYIDENMSTYRKGVPGSWSMLSLTQERIDKEFLDQITVLQKINELSEYKHNKAVLVRTQKLTASYIGRSLYSSSYGVSSFFRFLSLLGTDICIIILKRAIDKLRGYRY